MRFLKRTIPMVIAMSTLLACTPLESSTIDSSNSTPPTSESIPSESTSTSDDLLYKQVHIPQVPSGTNLYQAATLSIGEENVPLVNVKVNNTHVYGYPEPNRIDAGYARVFLRGRIRFTLQTTYDINVSTKVYPSFYNIMPTHDTGARKIYFTIYEPGVYVIEPNDNPDQAIHLRVFDIEEMLDLEKVSELYPTHNIISFGPGTYSQQNSPLIDSNNFIHLSSNDLLYIDEGAIVNARIKGNHVSNVVIQGHGIISGASFSRTQTLVPIDFIQSNQISINNVSILDPAAWTLNLYFVSDSEVNNVSIISSRANGDGVTIQSGKNIIVDNVFVRGFDDTFVVKNYAYPYGNKDRSTHGSTDNITFRNSYLWVDLAQAMEIGYETAGPHIDNVTFENITVFHAFHKPVISIHNSNYADLHNITYKNITVEHLATGQGDAGSNDELIDIKSTISTTFGDKAVGPTEIGNVYNLDIVDVLVKRKANGNNAKITLHGQKDNRIDYLNRLSVVDGVLLEKITIGSQNIDRNYTYLNINQYVSNLSVVSGTASGHVITRQFSSETLNLYHDPIQYL